MHDRNPFPTRRDYWLCFAAFLLVAAMCAYFQFQAFSWRAEARGTREMFDAVQEALISVDGQISKLTHERDYANRDVEHLKARLAAAGLDPDPNNN